MCLSLLSSLLIHLIQVLNVLLVLKLLKNISSYFFIILSMSIFLTYNYLDSIKGSNTETALNTDSKLLGGMSGDMKDQ